MVSNAEGCSGTGKKLKFLFSCSYFHIPFCFSSVNQIFPFESVLTSQVCDMSVGFDRLSQTGILNSSLLLLLASNFPRVPNLVDIYQTESLSAEIPNGISHFCGSKYSVMNEFLLRVEFIPQN